ncbi:10673_t:CDS:2 [Acaulospora morrowiae]|uniref:Maltase n=1 Tax=Acaulospora morrowiae TaxID=94023 RepID=A0A9N9A1E9_9GLOM|nr:10673_t:CDS:2 [Acaulospora morrowiae]
MSLHTSPEENVFAAQDGYNLKDVMKSPSTFKGRLVLSQEHVDLIPAFGADLRDLSIFVEYQTSNRLRICISDPAEKRWRVPEDVVSVDKIKMSADDLKYEFGFEQNPFGFYVTRKADGDRIFDTVNERLIFKDQYIEFSTKLPSNSNIYGFGETTGRLKRQPGKRMTMWARDAPCPEGENLYGSHPFYLELRNGKAHGVFLLNSNGIDIIYEEERLTYKVIGGILDLYIFLGPTPIDVIEQYSELIGRPYFIPYWSLGYHQCRWGYDTIQKLEEMVNRYQAESIPMDVAWIDIDYMDLYKPFTYSPTRFPPEKFAEFVRKLHERHQKLVVILDPGIKIEKGFRPYDEGFEKNLFIKRADGENFVGKVWPGTTVFPDWFHPKTQEYWTETIRRWLSQVPIDGLWIDMNEIANFIDGDLSHEANKSRRDDKIFVPKIQQDSNQTVVEEVSFIKKIKEFVTFFRQGDKQKEEIVVVTTTTTNTSTTSTTVIDLEPSINNPPYAINNGGKELALFTHTSPMDAIHHSGITEYDAHNLFGHMEAIATHRALSSINPDQRVFILSRSTFPSSGKYAAHWLGDNWSEWTDLTYSIAGMLAFQLFVIPMTGADICGFNGRCNEELAIRWFQLGSFYPFCRNHNAINMPGQECYMTEKVKQISKVWLEVRYHLLPYWYTNFYHAAKKGTPVIEPLWFINPEVEDTWDIDRQFLVGDGLLVSPVTESKCTKVKGYIPSGRWYDYLSGTKFHEGHGQWVEIDAPLEIIPVHVRGGKIIPMHSHIGLTSYECRKNGIKLLIALDREGEAKGDLYLDDGETPYNRVGDNYTLVTCVVQNGLLKVDGTFRYKGQGAFVDEITVLGIDDPDNGKKVIVTADQKETVVSAQNVSRETSKLIITGLRIQLTCGFMVSWNC